jgi:hypothetical protein
MQKGLGRVAQVAEYLPIKVKALNSNHRTTKKGVGRGDADLTLLRHPNKPSGPGTVEELVPWTAAGVQDALKLVSQLGFPVPSHTVWSVYKQSKATRPAAFWLWFLACSSPS